MCNGPKQVRRNHNAVCIELLDLKTALKMMKRGLYRLNKIFHGQAIPTEIGCNLSTAGTSIDQSPVFQGTDSGVLTTASSIWCSSKILLSSFNRFHALQVMKDT